MKESKGTASIESRMYKMEECGDSLDYKKMVDKWRCSNGLEPLYSAEKEKQVVSIG